MTEEYLKELMRHVDNLDVTGVCGLLAAIAQQKGIQTYMMMKPELKMQHMTIELTKRQFYTAESAMEKFGFIKREPSSYD